MTQLSLIKYLRYTILINNRLNLDRNIEICKLETQKSIKRGLELLKEEVQWRVGNLQKESWRNGRRKKIIEKKIWSGNEGL